MVLIGLLLASLGGISMAQQTNMPPSAQKTWADLVMFTGDVRYRYESIKNDGALGANGQPFTEQRDRIRARVTATAKCNDDLTAVIGIATATGATGSGNPVSLNDTLGTGESQKSIFLNLAYFDYNCFNENPYGELHGDAGKMKNPFMNNSFVMMPEISCLIRT